MADNDANHQHLTHYFEGYREALLIHTHGEAVVLGEWGIDIDRYAPDGAKRVSYDQGVADLLKTVGPKENATATGKFYDDYFSKENKGTNGYFRNKIDLCRELRIRLAKLKAFYAAEAKLGTHNKSVPKAADVPLMEQEVRELTNHI